MCLEKPGLKKIIDALNQTVNCGSPQMTHRHTTVTENHQTLSTNTLPVNQRTRPAILRHTPPESSGRYQRGIRPTRLSLQAPSQMRIATRSSPQHPFTVRESKRLPPNPLPPHRSLDSQPPTPWLVMILDGSLLKMKRQLSTTTPPNRIG